MQNLVLYVNLSLIENWIPKAIIIITCYEITLNYSFTNQMYVIHLLLVLWIIWLYFDEMSTKELYLETFS